MAVRFTRAVQVACFSAIAPTIASFDVSEWLAEEGKKDEAAVQKAECWCKELGTLAASRLSTSSEEIEQLGRTKESHHYENQRLRLEVKAHQDEASSHSQSLETHRAISARHQAESQADEEEIQNALHGIRRAIKALPEGSQGGEVHGTLTSLEDKFVQHLEDAQTSSGSSGSQADDLMKAKQEMMRLANAGATSKQQRLAAGLAVVAQAEKEIEVFNKQQTADYKLQSAVTSLCDSLSTQATARQNKRQATLVVSSQVAADKAQQDALHAAGMVLLHQHVPALRGGASRKAVAEHKHNSTVAMVASTQRVASAALSCPAQLELAEGNRQRAKDVLGGQEQAASGLFASVEKSQEVENALTSMLHGQMTGAHLATNKVSNEGLRTAVDDIFTLVQQQLNTVAAPFGQIRADGKESSLADSSLVIQLRLSLADAEQAVIAAKTCS